MLKKTKEKKAEDKRLGFKSAIAGLEASILSFVLCAPPPHDVQLFVAGLQVVTAGKSPVRLHPTALHQQLREQTYAHSAPNQCKP